MSKTEARQKREEKDTLFYEVVGIAGMNLRGDASPILKESLQRYIDRYGELSKPTPRKKGPAG